MDASPSAYTSQMLSSCNFYTLSERLLRKVTDLAPVDEEWVLFCQDHRQEIIARAAHLTIHENNKFRYKYRLHDYLIQLDQNPDLKWLIFYINDLDTTMDFTSSIETLLIPSLSHIAELRTTFKSARATFNSNS